MKISEILFLRFAVFSGVPQRSVLGSLLFAVFINYICSAFKCCSWFFADDIKIFRVINSTDDCTLMLPDTDCIQGWCTADVLKRNIGKKEWARDLKIGKTNLVQHVNRLRKFWFIRTDIIKHFLAVIHSKLCLH